VGGKVKRVCHWNGNGTLPYPFHIVQLKKRACGYGRVPETPFYDYTLDTGMDHNRRIKEKESSIY